MKETIARRRANEAHITPATMPALKEALNDEPEYGTPWNTRKKENIKI